MRARAVTTSLTAACLLAAPLGAGCSSPGDTSSAEQSRPAATPAITKEQAQQVLTSYSGAVNAAVRNYSPTTLQAAEADPQLSMDVAALKLRRAVKQRPQKIVFTNTQYYIPRLSGFPRWFAVGTVTGKGKRTVRHAMLFTQAKSGAPWLLTADPYLGDDALGRVALDPQGYATAAEPDVKGLAVAPGKLPQAHAALLTDGPGAAGASTLANGAQTTDAYKALQQGEKTLAGRGVTLSSRFSAAPYTVYALRTKDRGALVWYVLKQNEAYSSSKRGALSVGGDLVGLAPPKIKSTRMDTTVLVQYLAAVPPKGRATITGMYRKAVAVHGS